jgi:hypothetical protein
MRKVPINGQPNALHPMHEDLGTPVLAKPISKRLERVQWTVELAFTSLQHLREEMNGGYLLAI